MYQEFYGQDELEQSQAIDSTYSLIKQETVSLSVLPISLPSSFFIIIRTESFL